MAKRHTLKHNKLFEKMAIREIEKVLGKGQSATWSDKHLAWEMPYGDGKVSITLMRGDAEFGITTASWLACRLQNEKHVGSDGYTLPRDQIPGGWPGYFTYPSGKCNLHISPQDTEEEMLRDLAMHLNKISEPGSKYKEAFGEIEIEPTTPTFGM